MCSAGSTGSTPGTSVEGGEPTSPGEMAVLRRIVALCGQLSALAGEQREASVVVRFLAEQLDARVALLDVDLEVLANSAPPDHGQTQRSDVVATLRSHAGAAGWATVLEAAWRHRRALTVPPVGPQEAGSMVLAPVVVGDDVGGYLVTWSGQSPGLREDLRLLATEHAAMVCGVILGRDLVVAAAAGRARQDLVDGLLRHGAADGESEQWARHLGLDPAGTYCVITLTPSASMTEHDRARAQTQLARRVPEGIVTVSLEEAVVIVPVGETGVAAQQARGLAEACGASNMRRPTATGVGNPASVAELPRSYTEARRALAVGQRLPNEHPVLTFAELGIHRLLLRVPDVGELRGFATEVLGPLVDDEHDPTTSYLTTLSIYFHENNSLRRAAERLHVHPNTVSYRVRRIEQLTGLALDTYRDRLMAEVAVEILDGLGRQ